MRYPSITHPRRSLLSILTSRSFRVWSIRWILAVVLAGLGSVAFNRLQLTNQFANYLDGKTRLEQIRNTNHDLRKEVQFLEKELAEISNPSWVEKQARERGMVRPEEQVFRIIEAPSHAAKTHGTVETQRGPYER